MRSIFIDKAQNQNRENRADGAKGNQTEGVHLGVFVASDGGNADTEGADEGNGHGAGRYAAGVKGNGQVIGIREKRKQENDDIKRHKEPSQRNPEKNAQHAYHKEKSYADGDGKNEDERIDVGHVCCKHLQIGFCNGDGDTQKKAYDQNEP